MACDHQVTHHLEYTTYSMVVAHENTHLPLPALGDLHSNIKFESLLRMMPNDSEESPQNPGDLKNSDSAGSSNSAYQGLLSTRSKRAEQWVNTIPGGSKGSRPASYMTEESCLRMGLNAESSNNDLYNKSTRSYSGAHRKRRGKGPAPGLLCRSAKLRKMMPSRSQ